MPKSQRLARIALILSLLLPVWFLVAALGSKLGLWDWRTGLGTMTFMMGPFLLGGVTLLGIIALIWCALKPPRKGWAIALSALVVPALMLVTGYGMSQRGAANPIHDVSTDAIDPPTFTDELVAFREQNELNPIRDYGVTLRESGPWGQGRPSDVADETHRSLVPRLYPDLEPIVTQNSLSTALAAAQAAMIDAGYKDVVSEPQDGRVQGYDETFWYGFKDDVVARVRETEAGTVIDFRSVSRVGLSDLGKNADRIRELRAATVAKLGA